MGSIQELHIPVGLSDVNSSSFLPDAKHCIVVDLGASLGPSLDVWQAPLGLCNAALC